jgi:hypothetical protein
MRIFKPENVYLKLLFFILIITFIIAGCKKLDLESNFEKEESEFDAKSFFIAPPNTSKLTKKVISEIIMRNEKEEFVTNFAKEIGFPVWDKIFVFVTRKNNLNNDSFGNTSISNTNNYDTIIFIPTVLVIYNSKYLYKYYP